MILGLLCSLGGSRGALMGKLMVKHQPMGFSWGLLGKNESLPSGILT